MQCISVHLAFQKLCKIYVYYGIRLKHANDEKPTTGYERVPHIYNSLCKEILACSFCSLWLVQLVLVTPCF